MINPENFSIRCYLGKNPKFQGDKKLITKEGVLVNAAGKRVTLHPRFRGILQYLLNIPDASIEAVGTGLKIGRLVEGKIESTAVFNNTTDKGFTVYALKINPDRLPKNLKFKTEGSPIRGANTKSSRIMINFDENDGNENEIATFIGGLPSRFENGRITTFNSNKEEAAKKKVAKKSKSNGHDVEDIKAKPARSRKKKNNPPEANVAVN